MLQANDLIKMYVNCRAAINKIFHIFKKKRRNLEKLKKIKLK